MQQTRTTTIQLPSNNHLTQVFFPKLAGMLPQYRCSLLRQTSPLSWRRISQYIGTFYGALTCASSQGHLQTLRDELALFVDEMPTCWWYYKTPHFETLLPDLVQAGKLLVTAPPQRELVCRFIGVLSIAQATMFTQQRLDQLREILELLYWRLDTLCETEDVLEM